MPLSRKNRLVRNRFLMEKYKNVYAEPGCHPFIIVLDHLKPNFNIGKIIRSAVNFGGYEIHIVGTKYFDPYPAKGSFKHIPVKFFDSIDESFAILKEQNYFIFALDMKGSKPIMDNKMPEKSAFVVGNEGKGLSFNPEQDKNLQAVHIPMFGQMESLNVSVAATIAMYEYVRQHDCKENVDLCEN